MQLMLCSTHNEQSHVSLPDQLASAWTLFFKSIGEPCYPHPHPFTLQDTLTPAQCYLPNRQIVVAIYAVPPTEDQLNYIGQLLQAQLQPEQSAPVRRATIMPYWRNIWLISGSPSATFAEDGSLSACSYDVCTAYTYLDEHTSEEDAIDWDHTLFVQCRACNQITVEGRGFHLKHYEAEGGLYASCCPIADAQPNTPLLRRAYQAAHQ
jgi:hypothetical protein